jgi:hypothetical protein
LGWVASSVFFLSLLFLNVENTLLTFCIGCVFVAWAVLEFALLLCAVNWKADDTSVVNAGVLKELASFDHGDIRSVVGCGAAWTWFV